MFKKRLILIFAVILSLVIAGCNDEESIEKKEEVIQHNWKESPLFESGSYTMIGEEGRLGFLYNDAEVDRFYPDKVQKYMWHFWGEEQELEGELKVVATHENDDEEIYVTGGGLSSANNGADKHMPSHMSLPKSGMWKLDAYIGDRLFGSVYVKVHEK
ncbi:hypothetical protein CSE16_20250 [Solibacillus sp. R5-41]|uniref:hypothetical protein n=1 Tax=Solibacillus sp. R5-41 TaxID=2048654 RepID=UPI000C128A2A|nr:hypothetical protein [Solibacillus sp. R5-41]ATP42155.1 hypothetical protein CSE16_20250 [Solibacillus sp. R5-41]